MKLALLSLAAAVGIAANANAAVTLKIKNFSGQQVWVQWTGMTGATSLAGTTGGFSIQPSTGTTNSAGYDLSTFTTTTANEYEITGFTMDGGRMWFTYGASGWAFDGTSYQPTLGNFTDVNFTKRFDWVEAKIAGTKDDNINTTAVDKFAIPISIEGYLSTNRAATTQILKSELGRKVYSPLAAIAANPNAASATTPTGASPTLQPITGNSPYIVINSNSLGLTPAPGYTGYQYSPFGQTGSFVRIVGNDNLIYRYNTPGGNVDPVALANGNAVPANYTWKNYENYVKLMDGRAVPSYTGTTTIAGSFSGAKTPTDAATTSSTYSLSVSWNPTEPRTLTYDSGNVIIQFTGFVTLTGTVTVPSTSTYEGTYTTEIKVPYGGLTNYYEMLKGSYQYAFMLDPTGVVGSNANYIYKFYKQGTTDPGYSQTSPFNNPPGNTVMTQIVGDLFAGMNLGAIGSTVTLPQAVTINGNKYTTTTTVGSMPSQDWFGLGAALAAATGKGGVYDYYYGYLQTNDEYYNRYAEALYPLSDAYAFAYSDRIQGGHVSVAWDASLSTAIDTIVITLLPDEVGPNKPNGGGRIEVHEYRNTASGDYFMTHDPAEMAKLDSGATQGWARTGRWFNAFTTPQAGTSPVCRLYLPPAQGDSHFYGRGADECSKAASIPGAVMEDPAYMHLYLPANGKCATDTTPVYRLYSNRADTNHRYVGDTATRTQMEVRGWVAEGDGPETVTMCAPV